jgi:hypothetical protein
MIFIIDSGLLSNILRRISLISALILSHNQCLSLLIFPTKYFISRISDRFHESYKPVTHLVTCADEIIYINA